VRGLEDPRPGAAASRLVDDIKTKHRGLHYRQDGVARHNLLQSKSLPKSPQPPLLKGE
jgi:hypothetical protein